jgi:hypothetical protein
MGPVGERVLGLPKVALDQFLESLDCLELILAGSTDGDLSPHVGSESKQIKDTLRVGLALVLGDSNGRGELFGRLGKQVGWTGVKPDFVVYDQGYFLHFWSFVKVELYLLKHGVGETPLATRELGDR